MQAVTSKSKNVVALSDYAVVAEDTLSVSKKYKVSSINNPINSLELNNVPSDQPIDFNVRVPGRLEDNANVVSAKESIKSVNNQVVTNPEPRLIKPVIKSTVFSLNQPQIHTIEKASTVVTKAAQKSVNNQAIQAVANPELRLVKPVIKSAVVTKEAQRSVNNQAIQVVANPQPRHQGESISNAPIDQPQIHTIEKSTSTVTTKGTQKSINNQVKNPEPCHQRESISNSPIDHSTTKVFLSTPTSVSAGNNGVNKQPPNLVPIQLPSKINNLKSRQLPSLQKLNTPIPIIVEKTSFKEPCSQLRVEPATGPVKISALSPTSNPLDYLKISSVMSLRPEHSASPTTTNEQHRQFENSNSNANKNKINLPHLTSMVQQPGTPSATEGSNRNVYIFSNNNVGTGESSLPSRVRFVGVRSASLLSPENSKNRFIDQSRASLPTLSNSHKQVTTTSTITHGLQHIDSATVPSRYQQPKLTISLKQQIIDLTSPKYPLAQQLQHQQPLQQQHLHQRHQPQTQQHHQQNILYPNNFKHQIVANHDKKRDFSRPIALQNQQILLPISYTINTATKTNTSNLLSSAPSSGSIIKTSRLATTSSTGLQQPVLITVVKPSTYLLPSSQQQPRLLSDISKMESTTIQYLTMAGNAVFRNQNQASSSSNRSPLIHEFPQFPTKTTSQHQPKQQQPHQEVSLTSSLDGAAKLSTMKSLQISDFIPDGGDPSFIKILGLECCVQELQSEYFNISKSLLNASGVSDCVATCSGKGQSDSSSYIHSCKDSGFAAAGSDHFRLKGYKKSGKVSLSSSRLPISVTSSVDIVDPVSKGFQTQSSKAEGMKVFGEPKLPRYSNMVTPFLPPMKTTISSLATNSGCFEAKKTTPITPKKTETTMATTPKTTIATEPTTATTLKLSVTTEPTLATTEPTTAITPKSTVTTEPITSKATVTTEPTTAIKPKSTVATTPTMASTAITPKSTVTAEPTMTIKPTTTISIESTVTKKLSQEASTTLTETSTTSHGVELNKSSSFSTTDKDACDSSDNDAEFEMLSNGTVVNKNLAEKNLLVSTLRTRMIATSTDTDNGDEDEPEETGEFEMLSNGTIVNKTAVETSLVVITGSPTKSQVINTTNDPCDSNEQTEDMVEDESCQFEILSNDSVVGKAHRKGFSILFNLYLYLYIKELKKTTLIYLTLIKLNYKGV